MNLFYVVLQVSHIDFSLLYFFGYRIGGSGMDLHRPVSDPTKLPRWNYGDSSTGQAPGEGSEVILYPQAIFKDPFRRGNILLCVMLNTPAGEPIPTNKRANPANIFSQPDVVAEEPWYGIQQEYTLLHKDINCPVGWPIGGYPGPQVQYYCGAGADKAFGRDIFDSHYKACLYAGINISGINGEVMPAQWEFQVDPAVGICAGDELWVARVAVDADGSPVTVSLGGDSRRNIIVWMDHRAVKQAERINYNNSPVLQYCGGALSPEMQPPKIPDTDSRDMEACGWDDDFWEEIGLGDLVDGHHAKIGGSVAFPGHSLGSGLTATAVKVRNFLRTLISKGSPFDNICGPYRKILYKTVNHVSNYSDFENMGMEVGTPVGTSLIDPHAGGVGVMESVPVSDSKEDDKEAICHRMVLVCGTSTCHMAVSQTKVFIPGVWGPFWSAIINNHIAAPHLANHAASQGVSVFELLNKMLESMMQDLNTPFLAALTEDLHVLPDFLGNSTKSMRNDGGYEIIKKAIEKLSLRHKEHIAACGEGNERRLTGHHETTDINSFKWIIFRLLFRDKTVLGLLTVGIPAQKMSLFAQIPYKYQKQRKPAVR
ncbi:hypothetical protein AQUCO_11200021v1 [Aquilegia coerulea]|uniref:glutamine synthetase n=1 Tax=Aquilegia coerulea TaxID=218851 RepID=A0A2G5C2K3_AQUCA|nr:hypothetical protein AQUCO_11200021v1 [Aquilegia coerulea]